MESYFSSLDKELINKLRPLAEKHVKLFYPFFANTFPLAFHYYYALKTYAADVFKNNQEPIEQIAWTKPIKEILEYNNISVFYATENGIKDKNVTSKYVDTYQPRSMFIERTLHNIQVVNDIKENPVEASEALKRLVGTRKYIDIYSDIPQQAGSIINALKPSSYEWTLFFPQLDCNSSLLIPPRADTFRLYLYGGPLTTYLRRISNTNKRYIELALPAEIVAQNACDFDTYICINTKDAQLIEVLKGYHDIIFDAAAQDKYDEFWAIEGAYNRLAKSQQHNSYFVNAKEYVDCLKEHCKKDLSPSDDHVEIEIKNTLPYNNKPLVLFGCGDLGLGLVLPSLNPDIPKLIVSVKHEGSRIDWDDLIDRNYLEIKKNLDFRESYDCKTKDKVLEHTKWLPSERYITVLEGWDDPAVAEIIKKAGWIGTSVKEGLGQCINALCSITNNPKMPLLLFENVVPEKYPAKLQANYDIQHVICDRICQNREYQPENVLHVKCESYGEIIVLDKYSYLFNNNIPRYKFSYSVSDFGFISSKDVPNNGQVYIRLVPNQSVLELYKNRKRWLMNSIQYLSALLAIEWCITNDFDYRGIPATLAEDILEKGELRPYVEVFIQCQIGRMLLKRKSESDVPLLGKVLGEYNRLALYENLRYYVANNQKRCSNVPDMLTRLVTQENAKDRFKEHLDDPIEFYKNTKIQVDIKQLRQMFGSTFEEINLASREIDKIKGHVFVEVFKRHGKKVCHHAICPYETKEVD